MRLIKPPSPPLYLNNQNSGRAYPLQVHECQRLHISFWDHSSFTKFMKRSLTENSREKKRRRLQRLEKRKGQKRKMKRKHCNKQLESSSSDEDEEPMYAVSSSEMSFDKDALQNRCGRIQFRFSPIRKNLVEYLSLFKS